MKRLTDEQFRTFLDWWMVSDPWPDSVEVEVVEELLEEESSERNFETITVAYHEFKPEL